MQNLFVLVILETLEQANELTTLRKFKEITRNFKSAWSLLAKKEDPYRIKVEHLMHLFKSIPEPLGKTKTKEVNLFEMKASKTQRI